MPSPRLHPKDGHPRHPWLEASHRMHPVDDAPRRSSAAGLATACYYGLCTWVDRQVGRVIGALERTGLCRDDARRLHQRPRRQHRRARHVGQEHPLRRCRRRADDRGRPRRGARPASAARPSAWSTWRPPSWMPSARSPYGWAKDLPGRSLFEIGNAPDDPERTVFSEYHAFASPSAAFMLRNGRFKYNYYVGYPPELFDLAADPGEERNLARDWRARSDRVRNSRSSCAPCSIPKPRTPAPRLTRPPSSRASAAPRRPAMSARREPRRRRSEVVALGPILRAWCDGQGRPRTRSVSSRGRPSRVAKLCRCFDFVVA